jgi:Rod binding domain-containing protein
VSTALSAPALPAAAPLPLAVQSPLAAPSDAAARKAAQDFEAVFINELLSHMDDGQTTQGSFDGGQAEGVYRSLMKDAVAKDIAKRGGIGIADNVYHEILKMQEAKTAAARAEAPAPLPAQTRMEPAPKTEPVP